MMRVTAADKGAIEAVLPAPRVALPPMRNFTVEPDAALPPMRNLKVKPS